MNARSIAMIGLIAIMGIGAIMLIADFLTPQAPLARVSIALASQQIEPYTVITQDMLRAEEMTERDAAEIGAYAIDDVIGLMSTARIAPGTRITGSIAKPIENVRYTTDLGLEIVTFGAMIDRAVGGSLRPGHIINLYGSGKGDKGVPFTTLIEPQLWVVAVSNSGRPVTDATPRPDLETGDYKEEGGENVQPATLITVAVPPDKAFKIIDALGAQQMSAYVTLSASQTAASALATPAPQATATLAGLPPDLAATATALWNALRATQAPPPPRAGEGGAR
jgi:hypothetical protein